MTLKTNEWQAWGNQDAYYGVLTGPEYRKEQLTLERLEKFFATGTKHVEYILDRIAHHFGDTQRDKVLDYGCGVGRLVLAFSKHFGETYGADLSDGMLAEARKVTAEQQAKSVTLVQTDGTDLSALPADFGLVHSVIVFQHIPVSKGYAIMDNLLERVAPNGIFAIHVNIDRNVSRVHRVLSSARRFRIVHILANVLTRKPALEARMQMNCYSLDKIAQMMVQRGFDAMIAEPYSSYQGYHAYFIFGRRKV
jgi:ubiquinone/menaquinone biosynthesis C-methylase UbiE